MEIPNDKTVEDLYEVFRKPLLRYITYKVSDTHTAEEILNDVFFKAAVSIESLREASKVQSWLYKIASNQIIDYYRRKKENHSLRDCEEWHDEEEKETVYEELYCCMETFLDQLPKHYSDSLRAVYLDELTQAEYAEKKQLNLSTVKSQIKRGKESMRSFFEECCTFEKDRLDNIAACMHHYTGKKC